MATLPLFHLKAFQSSQFLKFSISVLTIFRSLAAFVLGPTYLPWTVGCSQPHSSIAGPTHPAQPLFGSQLPLRHHHHFTITITITVTITIDCHHHRQRPSPVLESSTAIRLPCHQSRRNLSLALNCPAAPRRHRALKRPRKRLRLDDNPCDSPDGDAVEYKHLPTPSLSTSGRGLDNAPVSASPSKRARDAQDELTACHDPTPRPPRLASAVDADVEGSVASYASGAFKVSRNSSPTKQLFHAELQQTGFRRANFATDQAPPSLLALRRELKRTQDGWKILPKYLQTEGCGHKMWPSLGAMMDAMFHMDATNLSISVGLLGKSTHHHSLTM
ncbi:hypothetical protein B0T10DRAFT_158321 [Thelonectria olida]|uniref:Uncharacterized protein n=1 Tax=Thelonectria olida TaxID=1576542 RepID=A0A9P9AJP6_9HYPO|nr:hypothetical protein B0T10DRAFT_158321 [Thelonectria olida]